MNGQPTTRTGPRWAAAAVLGGLVLAGCGGAATVTRSGLSTTTSTTAATPGRPTAATPGRATAAGNRDLTRREVVRLLALFRPPPGSRPVRASAVAKSLPGPVFGTPASPVTGPRSSVVDQAAVWQVATPMAATLAWVRAHPPAGLAFNGTAGITGGAGGPVEGYQFSSPSSAAWTDASVQIGVAPAPGGGSFVRADAVAVWLDPVPIPDNYPGRRVHVAATGPCPAGVDGLAGVTNDPPLTTSLLPPGRPSGGLVCRYGGEGSVGGSTPLDGPAAAAVAAQVAVLPLSHMDDYETSCPGDPDPPVIVALAYPGRTVDLFLSMSGCRVVANGAILANGTVDRLP